MCGLELELELELVEIEDIALRTGSWGTAWRRGMVKGWLQLVEGGAAVDSGKRF